MILYFIYALLVKMHTILDNHLHNFISCVNMNKCNALTCSLEPFSSPLCLSRNPLELDCPPEDAEDAADNDGERSRCLEDLDKDEADEADGNSSVGERADVE